MTTKWTRRSVIGALAIVALLIVAVPIVKLATSSAGVLEACVNPGNGDMRLVDPSTVCHNNETRVSWNIDGPAGPPGPTGPKGDTGATGPAGPPGSSSAGPPFEWICTPISIPNAAGNSGIDLSIFNGGANAANVAVHVLNEGGSNLAGQNIPGTNPAVPYPGQTGNNTVPVASFNTLHVLWQTAQSFQQNPATVGTTVHVTSDEPIAVGINIQWGGQNPTPCSLLAK